MELFVMISVQKQLSNGTVQHTHRAMTVTVEPGATRIDALGWAISQLPEHMRDAAITFFAAEPNRIQAPSPAVEPEPVPAGA
jgi:hypothetical protein